MKIVLISGGTSGLGLSMAKALAKENCKVYAAGRRIPSDLIELNNLEFIYMDITDNNTIDEAIQQIIEKHSIIDVLINSAGIGVAGPIEEIPMDNIFQAFNVNLFGTIRLIKSIVPYMRNQKDGLIVNISSIGGQSGYNRKASFKDNSKKKAKTAV